MESLTTKNCENIANSKPYTGTDTYFIRTTKMLTTQDNINICRYYKI